MDLSFLIPSQMRRTLLAYFVTNPEAQVYVNELAREVKRAPQLVYRELINLENWGFLFSSKRGNQRVFRVNQRFVYWNSIQDFFKRYAQEQNRVYQVNKTYELEATAKRLKKIPVPKELIPGLLGKKTKPRAYDEEILLNRRKNAN